VKSLLALPGRVARPASARWNGAKTFLQILVMWTVFFFLGPAAAYALEGRLPLRDYRFANPAMQTAGRLLFFCGGLLGLISAAFMVMHGEGTPLPADAPRRLVIAGPYRYVRNPMAMGSLAQGIAIALWRGSPLVGLYALAGVLGWNYLVRPWEEEDLTRRFGPPYRHYRDSVRCWIPRRRPYAPPRLRQES